MSNHKGDGAAKLNTGQLLAYVHVGRCLGCNRIVVGVTGAQTASKGTVQLGPARTEGIFLWPKTSRPSRAPDNADSHILQDYNEARDVLASSPNAAAVLARRCIQNVIRTRLGIKKKRLVDEIEVAATREELTKPTREALDHVRKIGNIGAHADVDDAMMIANVTREEAEYTIGTVELLFHDLYTLPARVAEMEASLASKS